MRDVNIPLLCDRLGMVMGNYTSVLTFDEQEYIRVEFETEAGMCFGIDVMNHDVPFID